MYKRYLCLWVLMAVVFNASDVFAFQEPTSGGFGYDFYDIAFNKFLRGAPGYVVSGLLLAMGLWKLGHGQMPPAAFSAASGLAIVTLPSIMKTMGLTSSVLETASRIGTLIW